MPSWSYREGSKGKAPAGGHALPARAPRPHRPELRRRWPPCCRQPLGPLPEMPRWSCRGREARGEAPAGQQGAAPSWPGGRRTGRSCSGGGRHAHAGRRPLGSRYRRCRGAAGEGRRGGKQMRRGAGLPPPPLDREEEEGGGAMVTWGRGAMDGEGFG